MPKPAPRLAHASRRCAAAASLPGEIWSAHQRRPSRWNVETRSSACFGGSPLWVTSSPRKTPGASSRFRFGHRSLLLVAPQRPPPPHHGTATGARGASRRKIEDPRPRDYDSCGCSGRRSSGAARRALVPALALRPSSPRASRSRPACRRSVRRTRRRLVPAVELTATVGPTTHLFADELTGRVVVRVDRRVVDPNSVRVDATFRPYGVIEPPRVTTTTAGDLVTREYRYRVFSSAPTAARRGPSAGASCSPRCASSCGRPTAASAHLAAPAAGRGRDEADAAGPAPARARRRRRAASGRHLSRRARPGGASPRPGRGSAGAGRIVLLVREVRRAVLVARERRRRPPTRLERRSDSSAGRSTTETSATGASRSTRSPRRSTRGTGRSRPRPATRPGRRAAPVAGDLRRSRRRRSGRRGQRHDADPPRRGGHVRHGAAEDPEAATRARGGARRRRGGRARSRVGATAGQALAPAAGDERGHRPRRLVEHRRPYPQADCAHARARGPDA